MTYEESRAKEKQEDQERTAKVQALIAGIKLGEGWLYQAPEPGEEGGNRVYGKLVNIRLRGEIWFGLDWKDKTRLTIHTGFPRDRQGHDHKGYNEVYPYITVSTSKTSEQITKDIQRRLLPEYLPMLAKVNERIQATEAYLDNKASLGAALKEAFPVLRLHDTINGTDYHGHKHNGSEVTLDKPYDKTPAVGIKCSETTVQITVSDLTLEQAKALLALVLSNKGDK